MLNYSRWERPHRGQTFDEFGRLVSYLGGIVLGTIAVVLSRENAHVDLCGVTIIVGAVDGTLVALAILFLRWRRRVSSLEDGKRFIAPLIALLLYPAAHGALCKLMSVESRDPARYAASTSPWLAALFWILICAVIAFAARRASTWGHQYRHYVVAGIATPIAAIALGEGYELLFCSIYQRVTPSIDFAPAGLLVVAHLLLAVPLIIALTFWPWPTEDGVRPIPASVPLNEQQTLEVARQLEAITTSPDPVELR